MLQELHNKHLLVLVLQWSLHFAGSIAAAAAFEEQFVNVKKTLDVKGSTREIEESLVTFQKIKRAS